MFAKTDVNGENQNPIYTFLKSRCDPPRQEFSATKKYYYEPFHGSDIRWNFEKFLVDGDGHPIRRYDESLDPSRIVPDIDRELLKLASNQDDISDQQQDDMSDLQQDDMSDQQQ